MRIHLQGTFLLIVLLVVFWWMLSWAAAIVDSALFGSDGVIVAKARLETDDPAGTAGGSQQDETLDGNEVAVLQGLLTQFGYSPGPVDGISGELTRQAINEAKADLRLDEESDRKLLETLETALEALESAPDSDGPEP